MGARRAMRGMSAACLLLAGCGGVLRGTPETTLHAMGVSSWLLLAVSPDRGVFLPCEGNLLRYDPRRDRHEQVFLEAGPEIQSVACLSSGALLFADGERLATCVAGCRVPVATLPAVGKALSVWADRYAYVACAPDGGGGLLCRYDLERKELRELMATEEPIWELAAVRGGCLVAQGGAVHRVFDDTGEGDPPADASAEEVRLFFVLALKDDPVTSIDADPATRVVYFADNDVTYAYLDGEVVPMAPMGGAVRVRGDVLTIFDSVRRQLLEVPDAADRARRALAAKP